VCVSSYRDRRVRLIEVANSPELVDICVTVDKGVITATEVHVEANGLQVYPNIAANKSKAKLKEDFIWC